MGLALVAYSKPRANRMLRVEISKLKPGVCDVSSLALMLMWALWFHCIFFLYTAALCAATLGVCSK